jgi:DNA-directed RNA polymerase omega subunit
MTKKLERTMNDIEKCVKNVGGSRFDLVLIASTRVRELKRGAMPLVENNNGSTAAVLALKEIEEGKIGRDHLRKIT